MLHHHALLSQVWCEFGAPINWSEVDHQRCQNLYYFLTSKINFGPCQKAGLDDHIINNNIIECLLMLFIKTLLTFNKSNLTFKQRIIRIIKLARIFLMQQRNANFFIEFQGNFVTHWFANFYRHHLSRNHVLHCLHCGLAPLARRGSYTLSLAVVIKPHHLTSR